jgi:hypothetical protein
MFQYPGTYGHVPISPTISRRCMQKALAIVVADPLGADAAQEPGAMGADIAVGSTQRFGVPMGYGGPHAAYMACRDAYKRAMPGGSSASRRQPRQPAYRLSLQTREQHIRREKATSNVCTAQALLAVMASMYACSTGPRASRPSRSASTARPCAGRAWRRRVSRSSPSLLRHDHRGCRAASGGVILKAGVREGSTCARSAKTRSASRSTRRRARPSRPSGAPSASHGKDDIHRRIPPARSADPA